MFTTTLFKLLLFNKSIFIKGVVDDADPGANLLWKIPLAGGLFHLTAVYFQHYPPQVLEKRSPQSRFPFHWLFDVFIYDPTSYSKKADQENCFLGHLGQNSAKFSYFKKFYTGIN